MLARNILLFATSINALHLEFEPPDGAFFIKDATSGSQHENNRQIDRQHDGVRMFLPDDCPASPDQMLHASHAGVHKRASIMQSLYADWSHPHCGIVARLASAASITKIQPIIDVLVYADVRFLPTDGRPLCATVVGLHSMTFIRSACEISSHQSHCLVRLTIPLHWWANSTSSDDRSRHVELDYQISDNYCDDRWLTNHHSASNRFINNHEQPIHQLSMDSLLPVRPVSSVQLIDYNETLHYQSITILRTNLLALNLLRPALINQGHTFTAQLAITDLRTFSMNQSRDIVWPFNQLVISCALVSGVHLLKIYNASDSNWLISSYAIDSEHRLITLTTKYYANQYAKHGTLSSTPLATSIVNNATTDNPTLPADNLNNEKLAFLLFQVDPDARDVTLHWRVLEYSTDLRNLPKPMAPIRDFDTDFDNLNATNSEDNPDDGEYLSDPLHQPPIDPVIIGDDLFVSNFSVNQSAEYAIVPMTAVSQLVNTAPISGQQISRSLKVFAIHTDGRVEDVTLKNSTCTSLNHRLLKVSPTCANIYLDGSESSGAVNASIKVSFTTQHSIVFNARLSIIVWYPQLPVDVWLSDPVLNAVKDWRLPTRRVLPSNRRRRAAMQFSCKARHQEAEIRVYAQFSVSTASDKRIHLGGASTKWLLDVTALAKQHVRVLNNTLAVAQQIGNGPLVLRGLLPGTSLVQLISPLSRRSIGATNVEISADHVSVRKMSALVTVDLDLKLAMAPQMPQQLLAVIKHKRIFTEQYQNGWTSMIVEYSDGVHSPLEWIASDQYELSMWPLDKDKLTVQPVGSASHPSIVRVVVLNDDQWGTEIHVELRAVDGCQKPNGLPLLKSNARVEAHFHHRTPPKPEHHPTNHQPHPYPMPSNQDYPDTSTIRFAPNKRELERFEDDPLQDSPSSQPRSLTTFEITLLILLSLFVLFGTTVAVNHYLGAGAPSRLHQRRYVTGHSPRSYKFQKLIPITNFLFRRGVDQSAEEWVWLSRDQIEASSSTGVGAANGSMSSKYSQRSTMPYPQEAAFMQQPNVQMRVDSGSYTSSTAVADHRSVSYRGSEISIFMSQHPVMQIHETNKRHTYGYATQPTASNGRRAASWSKPRNKVRITSNPMVDSSSEQNLSTIGVNYYEQPPQYPVISFDPYAMALSRSNAKLEQSTGDVASVSWDDSELREYFGGLRETVA